jgi:oxygen-independent coproporphyrinogen III oxidase
MMRGLYIHIPFCVKKCSYCDFYSLPSRLDSLEGYVQAVIKEAGSYAKIAELSQSESLPLSERGMKGDFQSLNPSHSPFSKGRDSVLSIQTLYIGGGTPSLLGAKYLKDLIGGLEKTLKLGCTSSSQSSEIVQKCHPESALVSEGSPYVSQGDSSGTLYPQKDIATFGLVEATIEVNPESATPEFLEAAKESGINRVSFGVQSLSDDELKSIGRIHTAAQAIAAIKLAKKISFNSISADLIIGLPGQTRATLRRSLETLVGLGVEHLSVYCLSVEEGTPLAEDPPSDLPSDDAQAELYEKTCVFLAEHGFIHYEISNFAREGYECLHNLNYWRGGEYIGLGAAAASHLNGKRFKSQPDLDAYLKNPTGQKEYDEVISASKKAAEEAMLRLRLLGEGLDFEELATKFGRDNVKNLQSRLDGMVQEGLLISENSRYRLTPSRILTSNPIFARVVSA